MLPFWCTLVRFQFSNTILDWDQQRVIPSWTDLLSRSDLAVRLPQVFATLGPLVKVISFVELQNFLFHIAPHTRRKRRGVREYSCDRALHDIAASILPNLPVPISTKGGKVVDTALLRLGGARKLAHSTLPTMTVVVDRVAKLGRGKEGIIMRLLC